MGEWCWGSVSVDCGVSLVWLLMLRVVCMPIRIFVFFKIQRLLWLNRCGPEVSCTMKLKFGTIHREDVACKFDEVGLPGVWCQRQRQSFR